ncbi:MAG: FAD-dependent oxidoreductase [Anaerolineae bacterium]|nr:FAD-dependent oxidoreductase [Anaerolineae bacterium]
MKEYDVVVIGGSAAGISAAITARRFYPEKSILVIRREKQTVIPCGIPYVFGELSTCSKNLIPDGVLTNNRIDLLVDEVTDIDREGHVVKTTGGEQVRYSKLVLATGSLPIVPPIPGVEKKGVYAIKKSAPYLEEMIAAMDKAKDILIVGGGFIGVEIAEEANKNRDVNVRIVEMLEHCLLLNYDEEFSTLAEETLRSQGIELYVSERAEAFLGGEQVEKVKLSDGKELPADVVVLGIGAKANAELAKKVGLEIGPTGGIQVNRYMQTSDPDIFACGDCAEKVSFYDGTPSRLKLASIATMEARIAGANLFSIRRANEGVIGVYSTILGNTAFCAAGLTEREAVERGYKVITGTAESVNRHPGSMPGAAPLKVKLVFEAGTHILLGGQVSGAKSAGELINAISACISNRMTADDMATFQMGTHPALTASPIAYQLVNAAEVALASER